MVAARTVPTIKSSALDDTNLANTNKDIYEFTVTADSNYDLTWKQVDIELSGNCNSGNNFRDCVPTSSIEVYEDGKSTDLVSSTEAQALASSSDRYEITLSGLETITGGTSKTYEINAELQNFDGDNDSLGVNIDDNETAPHVETASNALASDSFVWSDSSANYEDTTSVQWFRGWKVLGLDTDTLSLTN